TAERGELATQPDLPSLFAGRKKGLITRPELLAAGFSPSAIDRMVAAGRLVVVFRGVYALGHKHLRPEAFWLAAVLAGGEGTALGYRTGAAAWEVRSAPVAFIEVITPGARGREQRGLRTHRARLEDDE